MAVAIPPESTDVKCQDHRFVWQAPPMLRLRFLQAVSPSAAVEDRSWRADLALQAAVSPIPYCVNKNTAKPHAQRMPVMVQKMFVHAASSP